MNLATRSHGFSHKKAILYVSILLIGISGLSSCKKGENDPFLSLRTRKARLTGEWRLSSGEKKEYSGGELQSSSTFDGTNQVNSSGVTPYSMEFNFKKDGTFILKVTDDMDYYTETGNWSFLGKNKDTHLKSKECILLSVTSDTDSNGTNTYSSFSDNSVSFQLDRLTNKEIEMSYVMDYSDNSGSSEKTEISYKFVKK